MIRSRSLHTSHLALALCAGLALGCGGDPGTDGSDGSSVPPGSEVTTPATLDQGWDDATREAFWFTPQGSQVMPYTWFLHLEQADSTALLRSEGRARVRMRHARAVKGKESATLCRTPRGSRRSVWMEEYVRVNAEPPMRERRQRLALRSRVRLNASTSAPSASLP